MSKPYALTIADLRSTCRLLAKIEVLGDGSRNEELVGRNQAGEIVVRAKGKVTPAKVQQFRNSYQYAVSVGIIKPPIEEEPI